MKSTSDQPFSLLDFLQIACLARRTVRLVVSKGSLRVGEIQVFEGELWTSVDALGSGEEALRRLLFAEGVSVEPAHLDARPEAGRTIRTPCEHAILQAAQARDEDRREAPASAASDPDLSAFEIPSFESSTPPPPPPKAPESFETLFEQATEALIDRRLDAAYSLLVRARALRDDPRVNTRLERLRELGVAARGNTRGSSNP